MRLLLDTNIVLDVFLKRQPFYEASKNIMDLSKFEQFDEYVSASTVTDIYYITSKNIKDAQATRNLLNQMLKTIHISAVTEDDIKNALHLSWKDFEDAVQFAVASSYEMDGIITRNKDDFHQAEINVWSPQEFLDIIAYLMK